MPHHAIKHRNLQNRGLLGLPLPIDVPTLPVVAPILTVAGLGAQPTTTTTPKSTPTTAPAPGNGGGGTGGSGGTGGTGGTGGSSGGNTGGTGGGSSGSSGGSNPAPADPAPNPPTAPNSNPSNPSDPSTPSQPNTPSDGSASAPVSNSNVPSSSGAPVVQNAAVAPNPSASSNGGDNGNGNSNTPVATDSNGQPIVLPGNTVSVPGGVSHQTAGVGPSTSDSPNTSSDNPSNSASDHKGISGGAIGGIVAVVIIISVFAALFLVRKYHQRRREARRTRWLPVMAENGTASVRSSFATNIDHGLRPTSAQDEIPALPPALISPSKVSDGMDAQWLIVDPPREGATTDHFGQPLPSPISVRPFSPTESYKFPRPPSHASHSPSEATLIGNFSTAHSNASLEHIPSSPSPSLPPPIPTFSATDSNRPVKRPFAPSLPDEVYVEPGQTVTIEDAYDDGWALIKKADGSKGLIPLACFEENDAQVDVPAFLAQHKRKSSLIQPRSLLGPIAR